MGQTRRPSWGLGQIRGQGTSCSCEWQAWRASPEEVKAKKKAAALRFFPRIGDRGMRHSLPLSFNSFYHHKVIAFGNMMRKIFVVYPGIVPNGELTRLRAARITEQESPVGVRIQLQPGPLWLCCVRQIGPKRSQNGADRDYSAEYRFQVKAPSLSCNSCGHTRYQCDGILGCTHEKW